jgi:hypothetical protein
MDWLLYLPCCDTPRRSGCRPCFEAVAGSRDDFSLLANNTRTFLALELFLAVLTPIYLRIEEVPPASLIYESTHSCFSPECTCLEQGHN